MTRISTTTAPAQRLSPDRLTGSVRTAAFALVLLIVDMTVAASLADERFTRFALLFLAAAGAAFVFRFPAATALALLGLTDFIFYPDFFMFSVGPINVRPFELALLGLLSVAVLRPRRETWGGTTGFALAAFLSLVAFSGAIAVMTGKAPLGDVFNWARPLALLTVFYVVIRVFPSSEQRKTLLIGAAVIAAVAGVVALLVSLGWGIGDSLSGPGLEGCQQGVRSVRGSARPARRAVA